MDNVYYLNCYGVNESENEKRLLFSSLKIILINYTEILITEISTTIVSTFFSGVGFIYLHLSSHPLSTI